MREGIETEKEITAKQQKEINKTGSRHDVFD